MKKAYIIENKCDSSPFCPAKTVCPAKAISQKRKFLIFAEVPRVDREKCTGCKQCLTYCPHGAIRMK